MRFLLIIAALILFSCKNKNYETSEFKLTLEAIYLANDTVFLKVKDNKDLEIKKIKILIKGKQAYQKINFNLPKNINFSNVDLEISSNPSQKTIQIKNIEVQNNNNIIIGTPGDQFIYYFFPVKGIGINFETGFHKLNHDNGNPYFTGNDLFKKLIKEELN